MPGFSSLGSSILRNNKRRKIDKLSRLHQQTGTTYTSKEFENSAPKRALRNIRVKIKEENRKTFQRKLIIFLVLLGLLIYFIGFAKF